MTGESIPWRMSPDVRARFFDYCRKPISAALIMGGTGLMLEHLFTYDGFDMLDFWGHEYLGLAFILGGMLLSTKWKQWKSLGLHDPRRWIR